MHVPVIARALLVVLVPLSLSACLVSPDNPCDPEAESALTQTSTLRGRVLDQNEVPVAGVSVVIAGRGDSQTSQEDGSFTFDALPPNDGDIGYELVAFPPEPMVGGRTYAPKLACRAEVEGVTLHVAVPPASPEVEIAQATAADRLFVAFGSAGDDARYVVEVRAPFEAWQTATLVDDSYAMAAADAMESAVTAVALHYIEDPSADAACDAFAYVHSTLENGNARCAEVRGMMVDGTEELLESHGSYQVRVRAETPIGAALVAEQLPELIRSPETTVPQRTSLVPTAVLPVMMAADPVKHEEMVSAMEVHAIVPTGDGRFAMVDGNAMAVVGLGDVVDEALAGSAGAPADTMVYDEGASVDGSAEIADDGGRAVAILPAGRWVRIWKERDDGAGGTSSEVEKVFIGSAEANEDHGVGGPEPEFDLDIGMNTASSDFRGFDWLWIPSGAVSDAAYNPPDAYMLLFRQGFVMLERERLADAIPSVLTDAFGGDLLDGQVDSEWGLDDMGVPTGGSGALCAGLGDGAEGIAGIVGSRTTRVCYDLEAALGQTLDLVASDILPTTLGSTARDTTFNLFVDRAGDRVFAARTDRFLGEAAGRLVDGLSEVRVGVRPGAVLITRMLDCADGAHEPVALVSNAGSLDVSVLAASADGEVSEITSLGLPGVPTGFLQDPDGVSCTDPFVWVQADDGRMFPVDMRKDRFGPPLCGDVACAVDTRGRADTGGVSRTADGAARVLIGGRGMLGELGFLRPAR